MANRFFNGEPAQIDYVLKVQAGNAVQVTNAVATIVDINNADIVSGNCTIEPTSAALVIILSFEWPNPIQGQYRVEYAVTYAGGTQDFFERPLLVEAEPASADVATYDLTTDIGITRLYAGDTDVNDPTWSDPEVQAMLGQSQNVPQLAAAMLFESAASDASFLALKTKIGPFNTDETMLAGRLMERAKQLRIISPAPILNNPPDQVFKSSFSDGLVPGNMQPW